MGLTMAADLCAAFIAHGKPADTPAAVIEWATTTRQRTLTGTLQSLPALISSYGVASPALIIVGSVVTLADKLAWFRRVENGPATMADSQQK
jgi:uroporphyrin-III C-methyltransferase/precorrin-2 dehydrogenase/sirohydrochlorin ferrochelatase